MMLFKTLNSNNSREVVSIHIDDEFINKLEEINNSVFDFYSNRLEKTITDENKKNILFHTNEMFSYHLSEMSKDSSFTLEKLLKDREMLVYIKNTKNKKHIHTKFYTTVALDETVDIVDSIQNTLLQEYETTIRYTTLGELL